MRDVANLVEFALVAFSQAVLFLLPVSTRVRAILSLAVLAPAVWLHIGRIPVRAPMSVSTEATLGIMCAVAMIAMALPQAWAKELPAERWHRRSGGT